MRVGAAVLFALAALPFHIAYGTATSAVVAVGIALVIALLLLWATRRLALWQYGAAPDDGILLHVQPRSADMADIDELVRLRALWRGVEPTSDFSSNFRRWFAAEQTSRHWWIAEDDRARAYGMVNVKMFERMPSPGQMASRWGYLANLFVDPEVRGGGIGGALVQAVIDFASAQRLVRLVLSPSMLSFPLYARLGFRPADELMVHPLQ
jgi:GNAT superfamily N-acetyltransferase